MAWQPGGATLTESAEAWADSAPKRSTLFYVGSVWLLYCLQITAAILTRNGYYEDYHIYVAMASNTAANVTEPFADRILGPWLASLLSHGAGTSPAASLAIVCALFWAMAGLPIALIFRQTRLPLNWAWIAALIPFPFVAARYYMVPDGIAVFFTLVFLLLWGEKKYAGSTLAVAVSILARNTSALGILLWPFSETRKRLVIFPAVGILAGMLLKRIFFSHNAQNIHGVSAIVYYPAKVLSDLLGNLFGFHPYLNTHPLCQKPVFAFAIPHLPLLGHVTRIGACPFDQGSVITSLLCYAFIFSLFPLLIFLWLRRAGASGMKVRASLFLFLFAFAPALGLTISRLFVEGFPFLIPLIGPAVGALPQASQDRWLNWARLYGLLSFIVMVLIGYFWRLYSPAAG